MDAQGWRALSSWVLSHPFRIGLVLFAAGGIVLAAIFGDIMTRGGDGDVGDGMCLAGSLAAAVVLVVVYYYVVKLQ